MGLELWLPMYVLASDDQLLMGIFPRRNAKVTVRMFKPFSDYLSEKIGKDIKVVTSRNFPSFWRNVTKGKYDIVHYNQLHYIESHEKFGYRVFAHNEEFGVNAIRGALIVRKDSGINSVKDLKSKTILFGGGKKAFVAYVVNSVEMHKAGLKRSEYITKFAKNPPNATIATYLKQADAAGIGDVGLKLPILKKKGVDISELKTISLSKSIPHIPWAVKKSLSTELEKSIQQAILSLNDSPEGRQILKQAGMTGIRESTDKDYDGSRNIIEAFEAIE